MKNIPLNTRQFISITACLVISLILGQGGIFAANQQHAAKAAAKSEGAGRLVILRSASLGSTIVGVKIDGNLVGQIDYNSRYDAPIAAGPHVLSVYSTIGRRGTEKPAEKRITVEAGKTYTYTAVHKDIQLILK